MFTITTNCQINNKNQSKLIKYTEKNYFLLLEKNCISHIYFYSKNKYNLISSQNERITFNMFYKFILLIVNVIFYRKLFKYNLQEFLFYIFLFYNLKAMNKQES